MSRPSAPARSAGRAAAAPGRAPPSKRPADRKALYGSLVLLVDLDGTLVDSEEINHKAFVQIFREFHLEDKMASVMEGLVTGRDFAGIMADIGLDTPTRQLMERRMEEIVSTADLHLLPGAHAAIRGLRKKGVKFSVATLNLSKKAMEILERQKMDDLFEPELVVGSDNLPWEKPNPRVVFEVLRRSGRSRAIIVGNAPRDVMLAKNCNLPVIYLKQIIPTSASIPRDAASFHMFEKRVLELEQRYDHKKIFWGNSWAEIPALVDKVLDAE